MTRCRIRWNPKVWPYVTSCTKEEGHEGEHEDKDGRQIPNVPGQQEAEDA